MKRTYVTLIHGFARLVMLSLAILLFAISVAQFAEAQVTNASITGKVTDTSGAVAPGVEVKATHLETNQTRSATTDAEGQYTINFLPIGGYSLEISAQGFKKFSQTGIVLSVGGSARVDPVLEVGALSDTVSITASAPAINTSDGSLGRTVENKEILNLPLVNRDVYTLLTLTPGVDATEGTNPFGSPAQISVVNGSPSGTGSINYFLDGGNNTAGGRNTGNALPNPDAVQEFRVITNNFGAEFGRFAGGMIDVVTKSGTNSFHGSLFHFLRNDALNATPWNVSEKPALRRNQFGGSFGGPVVKDRTFFFTSYSGLRQRETDIRSTAVVPTALERQGNFSASAVRPIDPRTGQPFPGGIIPSDRFDPTALNILRAAIPLANLPNNQYQAIVPHPENSNELVVKIDHKLTNAHQLTGSYFRQAGNETEGITGTGNLPWSTRTFDYKQQNINVGDTWTISPSLVNQLRLTYVRNFGERLNLPTQTLADFGSSFRIQGTPSLPQIAVTGFFTLGKAIGSSFIGSNYYGLRESLSWNKGRRFLKFGGEVQLEKNILDSLLNNYGLFNFTAATSGGRSNNALANFLLGLPATFNQDAPITKYADAWYYAAFVQDDFRIHPRLVLNLGLRYDLQPPFTDPQNRQVAYRAGARSAVIPVAPAGLLFPGDPGITRGIVKTDWNNFAPRVGLAWDPFGDGKTSVRAGAGVFYGSISADEWSATANQQPFSIRQQFNTPTSLTNIYANLPGGVSPFPYVYDPRNPRFLANAPIQAIGTDFRWPYTYQLNLTVERELSAGLSVSAGYVSTLGHRWPSVRDINYPVFGAGATAANVNARRPTAAAQPNVYSTITNLESVINTSYHGLQTTVEKRLTKGVSFKGFYTFSKALDGANSSAANGATSLQNPLNQRADRGRTNSDRRHNFVLSGIWNIDYFKGSNAVVRGLLNNWAISGIVSLRSGTPLTITAGSDRNLDGVNNDRANLIGNARLDPNRARSQVSAAWFDAAAFAVPALGQDGTAGRNIVDGPGSKNLDLGLFRDFKVREALTLQFRCEVTNFFNLVNLSAPNTVRSSTAFGTITAASPMRQVQLGLRLAF